MKHTFIFLLITMMSLTLTAQEDRQKLYHPEADAKADIEQALTKAKAEGKHVILQVGGNWCGWCYRFNDFVKQDSSINAIVEENFVLYHLNYSKENNNADLLTKYRFPQRFGFPVLLVLNGDGELLHTQDSAYLEEGKGYNSKKVQNFFLGWTVTALDPASYKKN